MTTQRLTEAQVHAACTDIAAQGERPTALTLLDKLGRGSLTTITKYLNSWNASDAAQSIKAEELPAVVKLPPALSKASEDLLKKVWQVAQDLADTRLDIERMALRQTEIAHQAKVEAALKLSEVQAVKIDHLEDALAELKSQRAKEHALNTDVLAQLSQAEKTQVALSKDNARFQNEIKALKKKVASLASENKTAQADLKTSNKATVTAEKLVAKLEGQLEVYRVFDKKPTLKT